MNGDLETVVPVSFKRRGIRRVAQTNLVVHDRTFLEALSRGFYWRHLLDTGVAKSGADLSRLEGIHSTSVNEQIRLTFLAPDIIERLMAGHQPRRLTLVWFQHHRLPLGWPAQRAIIDGFK